MTPRSRSPSRTQTPKSPQTQTTSSKRAAMTPVSRLCHTMRAVNKAIHSFADIYPYRPDNNVRSERLCFHFYKQANLSVMNFNECILGVLALIGKFY